MKWSASTGFSSSFVGLRFWWKGFLLCFWHFLKLRRASFQMKRVFFYFKRFCFWRFLKFCCSASLTWKSFNKKIIICWFWKVSIENILLGLEIFLLLKMSKWSHRWSPDMSSFIINTLLEMLKISIEKQHQIIL